MKKKEKTYIGLTLPPRLRDEFSQLAQKTGRSMAGYIRYLIERELEKAKRPPHKQ